MNTLLQKAGGAACTVAALALPPDVARAAAVESYPVKPIRIIVPSAASSGPDVMTRVLGSLLSEAWGQQIVADNRAGAAGNIGSEIAARAAPDGYTLLMATSQQLTGPLVFEKLGYNLLKDFSPISLVASTPYVLSVHPSVAATSVRDLVALAKAKPGTLHYGSSGVGGAPHLAAEMLKTMAGVNLVHVPYKSVVTALIDLAGGQVQMVVSVMPAALPLIKQGRLRPLAVTSMKRSPQAPELETIAESVPGYEMVGWYGLVAPIRTPLPIIRKLNAETNRALKSAGMQERLTALGATPLGTTPEEFTGFMREQTDKLRKTIDAAGLRAN